MRETSNDGIGAGVVAESSQCAGIEQLWELHLNMEIGQLQVACDLLRKYENRDPEEFLPRELPEPIHFESNKDYVRQVLASQVDLTGRETEFVPMSELPHDSRYDHYQNTVNAGTIPSQQVIQDYIEHHGQDYRLETEGPHPVERFRDRKAVVR